MSYEVRFELCCLNPDCQNHKNIMSFTHASCGGELYINRDGMINCRKCGQKYHILNSKQACNRCRNDINSNPVKISYNIALVARSYARNIEMYNFYDDLVDNIFIKK